MRIAHFSPGDWNPNRANGVARSVYCISEAQAAEGADVAIFALTRHPPEPPVGVDTFAFGRMRSPFQLDPLLLSALREWRPDVVHLHSVYVPENMVLARALRRWGIPYVVTPHGGISPAVESRGRWKKAIYRSLFELPMYNRAVMMHAVADGEHIRSYGVTAPIVSAVNGLDVQSMPSEYDPEIVTRRFPRLKGRRILVFLGRMDPFHKGLDLLVEGFEAIRGEHPDLALVLVGPDWRKRGADLSELIGKLDLKDDVVLWGPAYQTEKYSILRSADAFVHTSRWEAGVPFSVLEALACELPCLITPSADPSGLVEKYDAGLIAEPKPDAIGEGLRAFGGFSDDQLREMGRRGRRMVKEEFNWQKTARTLMTAYARYCRGADARQPVAASD